MAVIPLINPIIKTVIDESLTTDDVADAANYAKVFSGTAAATAVQMSKKGDIYVKTDTGVIYIAKTTTKASGWVDISTAT